VAVPNRRERGCPRPLAWSCVRDPTRCDHSRCRYRDEVELYEYALQLHHRQLAHVRSVRAATADVELE
jgi:hypothetical protein